MTTKTIAKLGLLTAVALVLGYVDSMIPISTIPGIKLGLSNTVLLYAIFLLDAKSAWILMFLKVGLSGLMFGGVTAMLYSFAGGLLSLSAMLLMRRVKGMSMIGVSVTGAVMHNVGQMIVACLVVQSRAILAYFPILLIAAVVTGILTGIVAKSAIRGIDAYAHHKNGTQPADSAPADKQQSTEESSQ